MAYAKEDKINVFKSAVKNVKALKNASASLSNSELKDVLNLLRQVVEDRSREEEEKALQAQKKAEGIAEIHRIAEKYGLTREDVLESYGVQVSISEENTKTKKPRKPVAEKYRFCDLNGEEHFWTGQGKIPLLLKKRMQADGITDKEHYRMSDEEIAAKSVASSVAE